jgi:hypothetical protein
MKDVKFSSTVESANQKRKKQAFKAAADVKENPKSLEQFFLKPEE